MDLSTGKEPPLHRRYNPKYLKFCVSQRYKNAKENIYEQVSELQKSSDFLDVCECLYHKDYKDWTILMGILGKVGTLRANELNLDLTAKKNVSKMKNLYCNLKGIVYPESNFTMKDMQEAIYAHHHAVLDNYGFEIRRHDFNPDTVEHFLRYRMRHFDFDLPHNPLFGKPAGEWPIIDK